MNRLSVKRRAQIVRVLCEGNSIRGTSRITGAAVNTVMKLLRDLGAACLDYQDKVMVDLPCERIQCDEIWSFVYAKAKNAEGPGQGDVWTWVALDADTKLVPCWHLGGRNTYDAYLFMRQLERRLANRVQLTTDGHSPYLNAVEWTFGPSIDYAMLAKIYDPDGEVSSDPRRVQGRPDKEHISTSLVERQNLTMRMSMRRFARKTNAFSKKIENHMYAISLHFMFYNFCRPHRSLKGKTPAVVTGLADRRWSLRELVGLVE